MFESDVIVNSFFFALTVICVSIGSFLWHTRRHERPLNARVYFFVVYFHCITIIVALRTLLSSIGVWSGDVTSILEVICVPLYFNVMLWEAFRVYFLFNLTASKVQFHTDDQTQALSPDNTFARHLHLISPRNLIISFCAITVSLMLVVLILVLTLHLYSSSMGFLLGIVITVFAYIGFYIYVGVKIRKVVDAFNIKKEFWIFSVIWGVIFALILTFAFEPSGILRNQSDMKFFLMLGQLFSYVAVILYPISTTFKFGDSAENSMELRQRTSVNNLETIQGVLVDAQAQEAFLQYLSHHFQVEDIFFLKKLSEFKQDPNQYGGKAILIYQRFIKPGAFLDLHLPLNMIAELDAVNDVEKAMSIDAHFFDKVEEFVMNRLEDPFHRFLKSEQYRALYQEIEKTERLTSGFKIIGVQ